jgi:hypothetical protein
VVQAALQEVALNPSCFLIPQAARTLETCGNERSVAKQNRGGQAYTNAYPGGQESTSLTLSQMQILCGPYTLKSTKALVDMLDLPPFEIKGDMVVRRYNVGQAMPIIKPSRRRRRSSRLFKQSSVRTISSCWRGGMITATRHTSN